MTTTELFEAIPARLNTKLAANLNKTLQWQITGDDPGIWALHLMDGTVRLIPGGVEKPDVTFTLARRDCQALEAGKLNPMQAFMTGKLKVTGDMGLAMKVPQLFPLGK